MGEEKLLLKVREMERENQQLQERLQEVRYVDTLKFSDRFWFTGLCV